MANKSIIFQAPDGSLVSVLAIDTGATDDHGHKLYRMGVAPSSSSGGALTPQATTSAYVTVTGSLLDTLSNQGISYTIVNTGANSLNWQVLGGNQPNLSDAVVVKAGAAVAASATDTYTVSPAPYRYYEVQVEDTVGGSHGTALVAYLLR